MAVEILDDADQRIESYETTETMQQGDDREFQGAHSGSADETAGYVLHVSCLSDYLT